MSDTQQEEVAGKREAGEGEVVQVPEPAEEWTSVTKEKTDQKRRLVPQVTLTKNDLGADSPRNREALALKEKLKKASLVSIRFTKEELFALRKPSVILPAMAALVDIVSLEPLEPCTIDPIDPEEVVRLWNLKSEANANAGRGRGSKPRGVPGSSSRDQDDYDDGRSSRWDQQRGGGVGAGGDRSGWDSGAGAGFELADFAAATERFRAETRNKNLGVGAAAATEDALERLMREQQADGDALDGALGGDMEDEEEPEWANEVGNDEGLYDEEGEDGRWDEPAPLVKNEATEQKRNLLLETLNVTRVAAAASHAHLGDLGALGEGSTHMLFLQQQQQQQQLQQQQQQQLLQQQQQQQQLLLQQHQLLLQQQQQQQQQAKVVDEWLYTDPSGNVQGPFTTAHMLDWFLSGYFTNDLPIKLRHWSTFHTLGLVFAHIGPFQGMPNEPRGAGNNSGQMSQIEQMQLLQQQQEQQLKLQAQAEHERQQQLLQQQLLQQQLLQQQQQQQLEQQQLLQQQQQQAQQRALQEQQALLERQQQQQKQQQLQLEKQRQQQLLLEQQQQQEAQQQQMELQRQQQLAAAQLAPWANKNTNTAPAASLLSIQQEAAIEAQRQQQLQQQMQPKMAGAWGAPAAPASPSLLQVQAEEANRKAAAAAATQNQSSQLRSLLGVVKSSDAPALAPHSAPAKAAAASAPSGWGVGAASSPSLRDIMLQEQLQQPAQEASKPPANSWAAKIGAGGGASAATPAAPARVPAVRQQAPASNTHAQAAARAAAAAEQEASAKKSKEAKDDFGGQGMSSEMAEWCAQSIKPISGSNDLTLLNYCYTLSNPAEIRATLAEYLGSSAAVSQLATDFIKRKDVAMTKRGQGRK